MLLAPATVYRPPVFHKLKGTETKQFFLSGPIQDAPDWQGEWIEKMKYRLGPSCVIFSPRNVGDRFPEYFKAMLWERTQINQVLSSSRGVMIFWLPLSLPLTDEEIEHMRATRQRPRPYAQTTRIEFGETCGLLRAGLVKGKVFLGMEAGFPNERYIQKLWEEVRGSPIASSLQELCDLCVAE